MPYSSFSSLKTTLGELLGLPLNLTYVLDFYCLLILDSPLPLGTWENYPLLAPLQLDGVMQLVLANGL